MRIRWLRAALRNVVEIHDFIAADRPAAARETVLRIETAVKQLAEYPLIGRPGRVRGTRELLVLGTPYLIAYRLEADAIQILRILHGARQWPERL
jgi:toxin ParE1/3/4